MPVALAMALSLWEQVGGTVTPPTGNHLLLEDGASFLLLEDNSSKLLLES